MKTRNIVIVLAAAAALIGCGDKEAPAVETNPSATAADTVQMASAELMEATVEVTAPDFTLTDQNGTAFRLQDQRGKVTVINFWATWCAPCLEEIPGFVKLQNETGPRGVQFVGVSTDEEGWEVVRPFLAKTLVNYPIVMDDGNVSAAYGPIAALPTTYVVDRKGTVRYFAQGAVSPQVLTPALTRLVNEK